MAGTSMCQGELEIVHDWPSMTKALGSEFEQTVTKDQEGRIDDIEHDLSVHR